MKIIIGAIALSIAMPAAAQTAPAHSAHQDHSQHQSRGAAAATPQDPHSGHQMPADTSKKGEHDQHKGHAMKDGCCADKDGNGKMDCCEKMGASTKPKTGEQAAQPQAHDQH